MALGRKSSLKQTCVRKFAVLVGIVVCASAAQADTNKTLKNVAVLGGLLSSGYAWHLDQSWDCAQGYEIGLHQGKDAELSALGVQVSNFACNNELSTSDEGISIRFAPALMATHWRASSGAGAASTSELTIVPRISYTYPVGPVHLDLSFGIGASYLSETSVGQRQKSTHFQFSDELGFGISDPKGRYRVVFQYRHISNADIATPNNGVDFKGITLNMKTW